MLVVAKYSALPEKNEDKRYTALYIHVHIYIRIYRSETPEQNSPLKVSEALQEILS